MTPAFKSACNQHVARIAPYAETLHDLTRAIIKHEAIVSRGKEMMQVAADHPQRYQDAINMTVGAFGDGYVSDRYATQDASEERFNCLPLKSVILEDVMDVLGEEELMNLVPIDLALCTQEMVDAFAACELKGFKNLFEAVGIKNGIAVRKEAKEPERKPVAPVAHMAAVLV